jgi:hypothetical protein
MVECRYPPTRERRGIGSVEGGLKHAPDFDGGFNCSKKEGVESRQSIREVLILDGSQTQGRPRIAPWSERTPEKEVY